MPEADELVVHLGVRDPDDGTVLLAATAVIVWPAWAGFVTGLVLEVAVVVRSRPARRLPGLAVLQRPAAVLVTALATSLGGRALAPLAAVAAPSAAHAPPTAVAAAPRTDPAADPTPPRQTHDYAISCPVSPCCGDYPLTCLWVAMFVSGGTGRQGRVRAPTTRRSRLS